MLDFQFLDGSVYTGEPPSDDSLLLAYSYVCYRAVDGSLTGGYLRVTNLLHEQISTLTWGPRKNAYVRKHHSGTHANRVVGVGRIYGDYNICGLGVGVFIPISIFPGEPGLRPYTSFDVENYYGKLHYSVRYTQQSTIDNINKK
jgi:hypothetical protein